MYAKGSYISTYPDFSTMPGSYVQLEYPADLCSSANTNFISYTQAPLDVLGIPFGMCVPVDLVYIMYSSSNCASTGFFFLSFY